MMLSATRAARVGVGVDEQHRQFVTAQSKDRTGRRDGAHRARTELAQQFVARRVTEGVVDLLEVIEVDVEEGERALLRPRVVEVREVGVDHVQEVATIAESRQFVGLRLAVTLFGDQTKVARR